jgi:hypothetical protein
MLRFCGFELELNVDTVLQRQGDHPSVVSASDSSGDPWLIVEAGSDAHQTTWICAPASPRAVELVSTGQATAVDVVRVVEGHAVPDERWSCSRLGQLAPVTLV